MAGKPKYGIIEIYHELVEKKGGQLPMAREISGLTGAPVPYIRGVLNRAKLPFSKIVGNGPAVEANIRKREERDEAFREKHASMTRSAGRYPTRIEMNLELGYERNSMQSAEIAKRLGLPLTLQRHRPEWASVSSYVKEAPTPPDAKPAAPDAKPAIPPVDVVHDFGHRAAPNMMRIYEIRNGDLLGEGKGWGHIAGEEYAPTERVMITCPVCGACRIISPRMHPFWLRNRLGKVVFVDSRACTGQVAY